MNIQFDIIEQTELDKSIETWKQTIRAIYADKKDKTMCNEIIKTLTSIADYSASVNNAYSQLTGGKWEQRLREAIHCEAIIAVVHAIKKISSKKGINGRKLNLISRDYILGSSDAVALLVLSY